MRKRIFVFMLLIFIAVININSEEVMRDGFKPGVSTMDFDAAMDYAKKNGLAIFIDFTGSDWCGWCKLMQGNVFTKKEWPEFAKENIALVTIDFPNDGSIVPQKYKNRNGELSKKYGVSGYPTYVILDSDGETELGRLGAGREKTVSSFINEVNDIISMSIGKIEKFSLKLKADEQKKYKEEVDKIKSLRAYISEWKKSNAESKLNESLDLIRKYKIEYMLTIMSKTDKDSYFKISDDLQKEEQILADWLDTEPENTEENQEKYGVYLKKIEDYKSKLGEISKKYL